jgi:hypothetical protein
VRTTTGSADDNLWRKQTTEVALIPNIPAASSVGSEKLAYVAQPNSTTVVNHLRGIQGEVALIPDIPAANSVGGFQQQFEASQQRFNAFQQQTNAFQQQANENHQQLFRILKVLILHVCQNANQLLVVLIGLLLKSVGLLLEGVELLLESFELLLKATDTVCCGNQCHVALDSLEMVHNSSDVRLSHANFSNRQPVCSGRALTRYHQSVTGRFQAQDGTQDTFGEGEGNPLHRQ